MKAKHAKKYLIIAFVLMITGIIAGAFGAHALEKVLTPDQLESWHTAVFYQQMQAIGLILLVILEDFLKYSFKIGLQLLLIGVVLFSGSIYLLATKDISGLSGLKSVLGPITPIGGVLMIAGWTVALFKMIKR